MTSTSNFDGSFDEDYTFVKVRTSIDSKEKMSEEIFDLPPQISFFGS